MGIGPLEATDEVAMGNQTQLLIILVIALGMVLAILWALFGPRRPSDESGYHVDLAERTRQRDAARARGERVEPVRYDGSGEDRRADADGE